MSVLEAIATSVTRKATHELGADGKKNHGKPKFITGDFDMYLLAQTWAPQVTKQHVTRTNSLVT
jgi:hypothetical protein